MNEGRHARDAVLTARRIVVKIGSSSLTTNDGGIDPARVRALVDAVAEVRARGAEVVLVSSGAIAAGLTPLGMKRRPRGLAAQQAAASVGQGLLVHRYTEELARHGLTAGQVLLTLDDVTRRGHYRNAYRTFAKLLELGVIAGGLLAPDARIYVEVPARTPLAALPATWQVHRTGKAGEVGYHLLKPAQEVRAGLERRSGPARPWWRRVAGRT